MHTYKPPHTHTHTAQMHTLMLLSHTRIPAQKHTPIRLSNTESQHPSTHPYCYHTLRIPAGQSRSTLTLLYAPHYIDTHETDIIILAMVDMQSETKQ